MNPQTLRQQAHDNFSRLAEAPREQWDARLSELCGDSPGLRQAVQKLVDRFDQLPAELPSLPEYGNVGEVDPDVATMTFNDTQVQAVVDRGLPMFENGTQLGDCQILCPLGRGGFGVVYAARQRLEPGAERLVALKFVKSNAELAQEIGAQSHFRHPHIVEVYDLAAAGRWQFIVMQLVQTEPTTTPVEPGAGLCCRTLADELKSGPLAPRRAAELARQISDAVAAAHSVRIAHLDIKPANVLLGPDGAAQLSDFSLAARQMDQDETYQRLGGTPGYAAPEQLVRRTDGGSLIDLRSDIFAIGATLYRMLTPQAIFPGKASSLAEYYDFLHSDACQDLSPAKAQPQLPHDLAAICQRCLAVDPQRRYQSAHELSTDLNRFLNHQPIDQTRRLDRVSLAIRRNPVASLAIAMLLVATVILSWRVVQDRGRLIQERDRARNSSEVAFNFALTMLDSTLDSTGEQPLREQLRSVVAEKVPQLDALSSTDDPWKTRRVAAKAHLWLGMEHFEADEFLPAIEQYDLAARLFAEIHDQRPDLDLKWIDRAAVQESRGMARLAMGDADGAREDFESAMASYGAAEQIVPANPSDYERWAKDLDNYSVFVAEQGNQWISIGRYQVAAVVADEAIRLVAADERFSEADRQKTCRILEKSWEAALKVPEAIKDSEFVASLPWEQQAVILPAMCREAMSDEYRQRPLRPELAMEAVAILEKTLAETPQLLDAANPENQQETRYNRYNAACIYAKAYEVVRDNQPVLGLHYHQQAIKHLAPSLEDAQLAQGARTDLDLELLRHSDSFPPLPVQAP